LAPRYAAAAPAESAVFASRERRYALLVPAARSLPADDAAPLRSVSIALAILDCFAVDAEVGPTAVARQLGIAKSTASRMLAVMAASGVLERRERGRYRLGLRMFEYGQLALNRLRLFEVSVPILADLRDRVHELVQLGVPIGAEILFLDRFEAERPDPRFHGEWRRMPAHSSSSGRAIAAFNPGVARAIMEADRARLTPYTVVDPRRLAEVLVEVRRRGYAATLEEAVEGIGSVAAPVLLGVDDGVRAVAAVSVVGPAQRFRRDGGAGLAAHARAAARRISAGVSAGQHGAAG
jgi:DNA-binding IclR family transcriptional regulator